jgi:hypothetical protein
MLILFSTKKKSKIKREKKKIERKIKESDENLFDDISFVKMESSK